MCPPGPHPASGPQHRSWDLLQSLPGPILPVVDASSNLHRRAVCRRDRHTWDCGQGIYTSHRETLHRKLEEHKTSKFESGHPGCYEVVFIKQGG